MLPNSRKKYPAPPSCRQVAVAAAVSPSSSAAAASSSNGRLLVNTRQRRGNDVDAFTFFKPGCWLPGSSVLRRSLPPPDKEKTRDGLKAVRRRLADDLENFAPPLVLH